MYQEVDFSYGAQATLNSISDSLVRIADALDRAYPKELTLEEKVEEWNKLQFQRRDPKVT